MPRHPSRAARRPGHRAQAILAILAALLLGACAARPRLAGNGEAPPPPASAPAPLAAPAAHAAHAASARTPAGASAAVVSAAPDAHAQLTQAIDAYIAQARFRHARWGIEVRDLDTGHTLYTHDADKLFIPASNAKLYTAALALDTLGPGHRFHTSLYATRRADARGVLRGNLVLVGHGDPGLGVATDSTPSDAWADRLAQALAQRGVRRVVGTLIADDTWYAGPPYGAGWEIDDDLGGYAPPVAALSVHDNAYTLSIGGDGRCCTLRLDPADVGITPVNRLAPAVQGVYDPLGLYRPPGSERLYVIGSRAPDLPPRIFTLAIPDPPRVAANLLVDALARHGIAFRGRIRVRRWPQSAWLASRPSRLRIADVPSVPLGELVEHMLKQSDNLYAQLLLLAVGKKQQASGECPDQEHPPTLTAGWGLCAMRAWLGGIGIEPGSTQFEEGSGLSRKDRVTPHATVTLLAWIARQPFARVLIPALPVAGVDGTLEDRFRGTPAAGNLRAKTGTLHLAYTLSGYVRAADGHRLAFAIMLNGYAAPRAPDGSYTVDPPTRDLDAIADIVTGYGKASAAPGDAAAPPAPAASTRSPGAPTGPGTTPARGDGSPP